jgi:hypothetical protein
MVSEFLIALEKEWGEISAQSKIEASYLSILAIGITCANQQVDVLFFSE